MKRMVVRAIRAQDNVTGKLGFRAVAENGEVIYEGRIIPSKRKLYDELEQSFGNAIWHGQKEHVGYSIVTN